MRIIEDIFEAYQIIGTDPGERGNARRTPTDVHNYNIFGTATYVHRLNDNNVLTYMVGLETQESRRSTYNYTYENEFGRAARQYLH